MLIDHVIGGKYRIAALIGQGGMGTVFEGVHTGTGARVAIKLIVSNDIKEEVFVRFQREARAAGAIDSQHIVRVFDLGVDDKTGHPFMVMERLYGEDLSQLMRRVGPLTPECAVALVAQAAMGLAKAHETGVVHRDVKPANLFLHDGDTGQVVVKILDFGIAKVRMDALQRAEEGGLTRTGSMLGSPHYMSPEQAQGLRTIDHRSDIWSLGVVLYKMLTGQTPHAHLQTLGQVILAICSGPVRPVQELAPWVPPEVAMIVHRALQPDPSRRFQSAYEMYAAMAPLVATLAPVSRLQIFPLSNAQRARVAPAVASGYARQDFPTHGTHHAMVQTADPPRPRRAMGVFFAAAGIFAALGLAGVGVAIMAKKSAHAARPPVMASAESDAPATPPPAIPDVPPVAASAAPGASAVAAERSVTVAVSPPNAVVEVDGEKRELSNGNLELRGPLGSVMKVRIVSNGSETVVPVAITDTGAIPPKVGPPPASAASRPVAHGKTAPTVAPPPKPSPATPSGTALNVKREFE